MTIPDKPAASLVERRAMEKTKWGKGIHALRGDCSNVMGLNKTGNIFIIFSPPPGPPINDIIRSCLLLGAWVQLLRSWTPDWGLTMFIEPVGKKSASSSS